MFIEEAYGDHQGGSKFYHLIRFEHDGAALLLQRWGKIGTTGQFKIGTGTPQEIDREFAKIEREKAGAKGYRLETIQSGDLSPFQMEGWLDQKPFTSNALARRHMLEAQGRVSPALKDILNYASVSDPQFDSRGQAITPLKELPPEEQPDGWGAF